MNIQRLKAGNKKATNLTLSENLIAEAKALKINLSQAAEMGLAKAVSAEKARIWKEENAEAIESSNEWVRKNGIPLEKYRQF